MQGDPLASCNQQYRAEAEKIVSEMQASLHVIEEGQPSVAVVMAKKLDALLEKFQKNNQCPHLSTPQGVYKDELRALMEALKQNALAAAEVAARKQQMMLEHQKGEERAWIIAGVGTGVILLAVIGTIIMLTRKS